MHLQRARLVATVSLATFLSACVDIGPPETKTFEKSYTTSGPVTLDIQNGSGDVTVTTGPSGQVRVRGEARLHAHLMATGTQRRLEEIAEKPPITQTGEILRITRPLPIGAGSLSINYTIEVPRNTEVRVRNGSGDIAVQGVDGPVALETGSGDIEVQGIAQRADVNAGSGDISLREIRGEVVTGARSGNLHLESVSGDIRAHTASGDIRIARPGGKVQARASSGDIEIDGVTADLRVTTSSGDCRITGNPAPRSDWEIETRSGEVILDVPERASFQFYGKSRSEVDSRVEMDVTEKARRALRGRVGKGEARVTVETGSGRILIR